MACRLVNLHTQALRIDLRGGDVLVLAPNERSGALREELLYDNPFVADWESAGWLRRLPARMDDVDAAAPAAPRRAARAPRPAKAVKAVKAAAPKKRAATRKAGKG
jgi:hypothetical protein